ncbi:MAG: FeoB-associated Cys-rich membrane protein [Ruminococcaceae bacterium]|nr:FeoB-associated Cys-rich membrane protein [Oscillospiraceae bacterium]
MNLPTFIVAAIVAAVFIAIVVKMISDKKNGKSSCSCGGNCRACGAGCSSMSCDR